MPAPLVLLPPSCSAGGASFSHSRTFDMTVSAKMILDSSANDECLSTIEARYPKFIHGELMTHRVFSRNASSSRAIPVERLIEDVLRDPALPEKWFKNKAGMQGTEEITGAERLELIAEYMNAMTDAVARARHMIRLNAHKQHINRILEPFCHITVLISSTQWTNFLALRDHPDADPTIAALAREIRKALATSLAMPLKPGEWHLPYVGLDDVFALEGDIVTLTKISVARCARVSYLTQERKVPSIVDDLGLYDRLLSGVPLHASPAEHQATPSKIRTTLLGDPILHVGKPTFVGKNLGGNFGPAWIQYRKTLVGECQ